MSAPRRPRGVGYTRSVVCRGRAPLRFRPRWRCGGGLATGDRHRRGGPDPVWFPRALVTRRAGGRPPHRRPRGAAGSIQAASSSRSNTCIASGGDLPSYVCSAATLTAACGSVSMVCGEAAETPVHVLLECPCLYGPRLRMLGNIVATERGLSNDDVVATFAAGYTAYKSLSSAATSPPRRWWRGATTTTTTTSRPRPCDWGAVSCLACSLTVA